MHNEENKQWDYLQGTEMRGNNTKAARGEKSRCILGMITIRFDCITVTKMKRRGQGGWIEKNLNYAFWTYDVHAASKAKREPTKKQHFSSDLCEWNKHTKEILFLHRPIWPCDETNKSKMKRNHDGWKI